MKISERTLRISAASLLALLMVGGAYLISGPSFLSEKFANAGSTDELLKAYATKDTDGDGLPDWQEALYGTDPNKAISNPFGIPDGQAAKEGKLTPQTAASQLPSDQQGTTTLTSADLPGVDPAPGSITEQFSQQFLQQYMAASNGQPMDDATQQQLVTSLMSNISQQVSQSLSSTYAPVSVHTSSSVSMSAYADSIETIFRSNEGDGNHPVDVMQALIQGTDPKAQQKLIAISKTYAAMATQLRATSVPTSMVSAHVQLVQSLDVLAASTAIVANYQKDPLATLGALSAYTASTNTFTQSLTQLATAILSNGEPKENDPGYFIVALARISAS